MIEVFKTNVKDDDDANMLVNQIHKTFKEYIANFDLQDCDNILRVKCTIQTIKPFCLIDLLKDFGFDAEVLSDDCLPQKILQPNTGQ